MTVFYGGWRKKRQPLVLYRHLEILLAWFFYARYDELDSFSVFR